MAIIHTKGKARKTLLLAGVSGHIGKTIVVKQYKKGKRIVAANFPGHSTDLRYIQTVLGHSSPKTTEIYAHVSTKSLAGVVSPLEKLDIQF